MMKELWNQHVRTNIKLFWTSQLHLVFSRHISAILSIPGLFEDFVENLETALPIALYYDHHDENVQKSITKEIIEFHFDNNLTKDNRKNVTNVIQ